MKKIVFFSQKGGSGKTTLSVHISVAASEDGEKVVLIDTDPQKSATVWGEARKEDTPIVVTTDDTELSNVLEAAANGEMTLAVVDTAPHATPAATQVVRSADCVVIPVRPSVFDIAAAGRAVKFVKSANVPAMFVLSACPFRSPEIEATREILLEKYELPVLQTQITDRRAFARAIASGTSVTEFESDGKAAIEIRDLWIELKKEMTHGKEK